MSKTYRKDPRTFEDKPEYRVAKSMIRKMRQERLMREKEQWEKEVLQEYERAAHDRE